MADIVRLGIVYDTSQAAASLTRLNQQLGTTQTRATQLAVVFAKANQRWATSSEILASMAKDAGRAAAALPKIIPPVEAVTRAVGVNVHAQTALKRGLVGLAMQATATSGPVGQLTQAMLLLGGGTGAILIVAAAVASLALIYEGWTRDTKDAEAAQRDLIKALESVGAHASLTAAKLQLNLLLAAQAKSQSFKEVGQQFLSDISGGHIGVSRDEQHERAARAIAAQMTIIANLEVKAANAGRDQLEVIHKINEENRIRIANRAAENAQGLFLSQQAILSQASARDRRLRGMDPRQAQFATEIPELAGFRKSLTAILQPTREVTQAEVLFKNGLFTMADAIEQFVIDGTASFTDFLDNILRLLYRDFSGNLIGNITNAIFPGTNTGPDSGGGGKDTGTIKGSVVSNVNFTVQTMDAQGVAQWVQRNGATVAAEVARQATRSRGMRKALSRG